MPARVAGTGVDIRAAGGDVVLPSPGNGRAWIKPLGSPARPPAWLPMADRDERANSLAKFSSRPVQNSSEQAPTSTRAYAGDSPYGLATLKRICADVVASPNGCQETTLDAGAYKIGRLIGAGELSDAAVQSLIDAGLAMASYDASRPWDPALVEAKVRRAIGQGMRRPYRPSPSFICVDRAIACGEAATESLMRMNNASQQATFVPICARRTKIS